MYTCYLISFYVNDDKTRNAICHLESTLQLRAHDFNWHWGTSRLLDRSKGRVETSRSRAVRGCGFSIVTCRLMHAAHSDIPQSDICSSRRSSAPKNAIANISPIGYCYCLQLYTVGVWATAVIDRRLRPRCCHLGSYFKRPKSSSVRPFACNWCYCAQVTAKPKAACALLFSWATT